MEIENKADALLQKLRLELKSLAVQALDQNDHAAVIKIMAILETLDSCIESSMADSLANPVKSPRTKSSHQTDKEFPKFRKRERNGVSHLVKEMPSYQHAISYEELHRVVNLLNSEECFGKKFKAKLVTTTTGLEEHKVRVAISFLLSTHALDVCKQKYSTNGMYLSLIHI